MIKVFVLAYLDYKMLTYFSCSAQGQFILRVDCPYTCELFQV